jgi:hypothetical protein
MRRPMILFTLLLTALLVFAGCGESASEKAGEKAAEELLGAENVEFDEDSGEMSIKDKDGNELSTSDGELPDGWPDEVPMPDGAKIESGLKTGTAKEGDSFVASAEVEQTPKEVLEFYKKELKGYEESSSMGGTTAGEDTGFATYTSDKYSVTVAVSEQSGKRMLSVTVTPAAK